MRKEDEVVKVVREGVSKNIELLKKSSRKWAIPKNAQVVEEQLKKFERLAEQVAKRQ